MFTALWCRLVCLCGAKAIRPAYLSITLTACAASSITPTLAWTLLNAGVALFGYYATAWLIDDISWGRYRIQVPHEHHGFPHTSLNKCQICWIAACLGLDALLTVYQTLYVAK